MTCDLVHHLGELARRRPAFAWKSIASAGSLTLSCLLMASPANAQFTLPGAAATQAQSTQSQPSAGIAAQLQTIDAAIASKN